MLRDQISWRVRFCDVPSVHHNNPIGSSWIGLSLNIVSNHNHILRNKHMLFVIPSVVHDGIETVCDGQNGAVLKLSSDSGLYQIVRLQVYSCSGFIQNQNLGLPQESSSQANQLPLTQAEAQNIQSDHMLIKWWINIVERRFVPEILSSLWTLMVEFVRQARHKVLEMCEFQSSPDLLISVAIKGVQIHTQGAGEQHWILEGGKRLKIKHSSFFLFLSLSRYSICFSIFRCTCGIMVIRDLSSCSPISAMFIPSMKIFPFAASRIRKIPRARDDFPAPVLPTIPTWIDSVNCLECNKK